MICIPKRLLALGGSVVALAAGGAAAAQGEAQAKPAKARAFQVQALKVSASYLGVTRAQLRRELPGHSLAQLATAKGKSVEGLEAAIVAAFQAKLDKRQAAGKVPAANAQQRAAALTQRVDRFVQRVFGKRVAALAVGSFRQVALREAAEFLGVDRRQLRTQLKGTSLAALATAQGKSVAALQAAILEPLQARVARAQANGRLTAAQAQERLSKLQARVATFVNRVRGA